MLTYGDYVYEAELPKSAVVEAEQYRLARLASDRGLSPEQVSERQGVGIRSRLAQEKRLLMVRLGNLLVTWGCELQSRYALESSRFLS